MANPALADSCPSPDQIRVGSTDKAFTQERYLNGVDQPLKSSGRIKIDNDEIHWHMLVPFDVDTIITPSGISQSVNGAPPEPAGVSGGLGPQLAKLFADLVQGKWAELNSTFKVTKNPTKAGSPWSVSLETIDPTLKKGINQIDVEGCTDISGIKIQHPNGDHEQITLDRSTGAGSATSQ